MDIARNYYAEMIMGIRLHMVLEFGIILSSLFRDTLWCNKIGTIADSKKISLVLFGLAS